MSGRCFDFEAELVIEIGDEADFEVVAVPEGSIVVQVEIDFEVVLVVEAEV